MAFADTIRLKDGSIIKGKIISFGDGKFTIVIGDGTRQRQMNFFADEVESIEFEAIPLASNSKQTQPVYKNTSSQKEDDKNNTVITAGQTETKPTPSPTPSKSVIITDKTTQPTTQTNTTQTNPNNTTTNPTYTNTNPAVKNETLAKAVTLNVKVLADNTANGWSNSGWVVKKGQKIRVSGKGQVNLGNGRFASAAGISSLPDNNKLVKTEATGGLIAVIGDDNNEFIFIGAAREFVAARDGALFLGINEGNLDDNSGAFDVTIEIVPN